MYFYLSMLMNVACTKMFVFTSDFNYLCSHRLNIEIKISRTTYNNKADIIINLENVHRLYFHYIYIYIHTH